MLILDEVITGFRFPKFSVSRWAGVTPDLICLGKAIANGFPLSVVGGKHAIMNSTEYFVSSTFAGELSALAAAKTCMTLLQTQYDIGKLWERGAEWIERFNYFWPEKLKLIGYPTRGVFVGDELVKALFFQEACLAGILFGPSWFFNYAHLELDDSYMTTLEEIIWSIRRGKVTLKGKMPQSPFSQKQRMTGN
jgi:glutamate-1-semialdehyde 2,1-aminomutase/spore coat polysaccharide biosynthesis protein SpsF